MSGAQAEKRDDPRRSLPHRRDQSGLYRQADPAEALQCAKAVSAKKARKTRQLERALQTAIPEQVYERLEQRIRKAERRHTAMTTSSSNLPPFRWRAGQDDLFLGFERVVEQMKEGQLWGLLHTGPFPKNLKELLFTQTAQAAADVFAADHAGHPAGLRQTLRHCRCNG